jgi:ribosomal protein L11 methyltransferase
VSGNSAWKIELFVPTAAADAFADAVEPFAAALTLFPVEGTTETRIAAYGADAPDEAALEATLATVAAAAGVTAPPAHVVWLPDIDWLAENRAQFAPVRAGRFYVHDSYREAPPPANVTAILVDAATAFGTGHHGTTRGCLEALEAVVRRRARLPAGPVLDLGCGTAVLGIAAAKTLARPVVASDIDPAAVAMARINARGNGVASRVRVFESVGFDNVAMRRPAPYALIFANILARPLVRLAPAITANLVPGGTVILSGLLHAQERQVLAAYLGQGLHLAGRIRHDEWSTLVCR